MNAKTRHPTFDPSTILHALEDARVDFILIGALARVLHGSDEVTQGVDLTPSPRPSNLERLAGALERIAAREVLDKEAGGTNLRTFESPPGRILLVSEPTGTRGFADLRRKARRFHLGEGLRPRVAGAGDLARMLEALARPEQNAHLESMRRIVELDRGLEREA